MIEDRKRRLEEIEFSIGTIKINRNINAKFTCFWTLCGGLCTNILQDDMDHSIMVMTGIYFISATVYGIKTCHQQLKILKLKNEKKMLN